MLSSGQVINGRYEIIKLIGEGGMAIVYKAKDKVLNRDVAVKVLKDEFTTEEIKELYNLRWQIEIRHLKRWKVCKKI